MLHKISSRRAKRFALKLGTLAFLSGAFFASQGFSQDFISILNSKGQIYSLNTSDGSVSLMRNFGDVPGTDQFSPNSLGYADGSYYFTTFGSSPVTVYQDGSSIGTGTGTTAVAAGAGSGDSYYFVNNSGTLFKTSSGGPVSSLGSVGIAPDDIDGTYGDMAFNGDNAVVSFDEPGGPVIGTFSLGDLGTVTKFALDVPANITKFLGLAYAGSNLYGITGSSPGNYQVWNIDLDLKSALNPVLIDSSAGTLTDAAVIPEPGVVIGMMLGFGFLGYSSLKRKRSSQITSVAA